jgi:hypothetical protein
MSREEIVERGELLSRLNATAKDAKSAKEMRGKEFSPLMNANRR